MIEAAMRQAGALHDFGDGDAVEPSLPEQPARNLHDPCAVFRRLLPADFHVFSPWALDNLYDVDHQYAKHNGRYSGVGNARSRAFGRAPARFSPWRISIPPRFW